MSSRFIPTVKHFCSRQRLQYDRDSTVTSHVPLHRPRISYQKHTHHDMHSHISTHQLNTQNYYHPVYLSSHK